VFQRFRRIFQPRTASQSAAPASDARGEDRPGSRFDRPGQALSPSRNLQNPNPPNPNPQNPNLQNPNPPNPNLQNAASQTSRQKSSLENLKQVLNVLRAYVVTFGRPDSELELRAVVGAIVANLPSVVIENRQLERFMDEAIAAFKSLGMEAALVDVTAQLTAEQVSVWLQAQEGTVGNVLSAYLQGFAPDDAEWNAGELIGLVQTVISTLNDGSLSRSGGQALLNRVINSFDLNRALNRWVAPEWVALAQRVASYVTHGNLQTELRSITWSYIQQFQAILSPQLIEQIIATGPLNLSPAELMSGDLDDFSQMLFYKFQLIEPEPVVTKSHEAIAASVHKSIADFQTRRQPGFDATVGIQTGDLEISSPLARNRNQSI
jgi:hypothetical protein